MMAAKKAPMKKMAAPAKTAPKKTSAPAKAKPMMTEAEIRKEIYRKYNMTDKSVVSRRSSGEPGKTGPISRKEYMQQFDGVVSESSLGTGPKVAKVAMKIAGEQWDRTFGPGKRTSADNIASAYGRGVRPKKK
jgi:hypothetical protein